MKYHIVVACILDTDMNGIIWYTSAFQPNYPHCEYFLETKSNIFTYIAHIFCVNFCLCSECMKSFEIWSTIECLVTGIADNYRIDQNGNLVNLLTSTW